LAAGTAFSKLDTIPALPTDVFRLTRVAAHPESADVSCFRTSGTTAARQGSHPFRTLGTYRTLSVAFAERALVPRAPRCTVVALAPLLGAASRSSLGTMMQFFMETFDGRLLPGEMERVPVAERSSRWLISGNGVNLAGLRLAAATASERNEPLLLLATSLALAALLDALHGERLELPEGSVVMPTGGNKGRAIAFDPERLHAEITRSLLPLSGRIIGEYGMTELTSQLYAVEGEIDLYREPPWLQVTALDPVTLMPLPMGETGLARFVDLGNVDSSVAVLTQDLVRREARGIRLLGRQTGSDLRGCSLAIESLLGRELNVGNG
jgi:hypothetical protein